MVAAAEKVKAELTISSGVQDLEGIIERYTHAVQRKTLAFHQEMATLATETLEAARAIVAGQPVLDLEDED